MNAVPPPIAFRSGLTAWAHSFGPWRIELASGAHDAPLYLATDCARIRWVHEAAEATCFETSSAAPAATPFACMMTGQATAARDGLPGDGRFAVVRCERRKDS